MDDELVTQAAALAEDRTSGASALAERALELLTLAVERPETTLLRTARALCAAQPSMAPIWNAALQALAAGSDRAAFNRYVERVRRSPDALLRFADAPFTGCDDPLRIVTLSASGSVLRALLALRRRHAIDAAIGEGRPMLEGRAAARQLAAAGIAVTLWTDAALAGALEDANALLVGADAVGPAAFLNKTGTFMTAAAAGLRGVPVYVLATRDKFVMPDLWPHLAVTDHPPAEVWDAPPDNVTVRNPYFEAVPLDLAAGFITDAGVLAAAMVPQLCESLQTGAMQAALARLTDL